MDDQRPAGPDSALPSTGARVLAFAAIVVGGLCGGLIGYAIVDLETDSSAAPALGAVIGAVLAAIGVAVLAVLVLRAMTEWRTIEHTQPEKPRGRRTGRSRSR